MYLDYSKLEFDSYGRPERPELLLQTLSGEALGVIPFVHDLTINVKFAEPSEMKFSIPAYVDGVKNPLYDSVTGRKLVYTKNYGVYVTMNPETEADGIKEIKSVTCYSIEKRLEDKRFYLEEGTFNFWNPAAPTDTIIARILEVVPDWSVGYVSPALIGRYRTFDSYNEYLLSFVYNTAPEKFRCVFVFDPYKKTINVYDADEERSTLPIYLDFENLVTELKTKELSDELVTAMRPYGADELDIRAVNPIGTNWIYDLSYFIANGDISDNLISKWENWQAAIAARQDLFKGLVGMRASATAQTLALQAELTDLNGELTNLTNQQSVTIQAYALESTDEGREYQQKLLDEINEKIASKEAEIDAKQAEIDAAGGNTYDEEIQSIVNELSIINYFTDEEYAILRQYFVEQDMTEETFVSSDLDTSVSGASYNVDNSSVSISDSTVMQVLLSEEYNKQMYVLTGGSFKISGGLSLSCDIIRGTLEAQNNGSFVLSLYAGTITVNNASVSTGLITISGTFSELTTDVTEVAEGDVVTLEGSAISFTSPSGSLYLTANISDYKKYSVQMELFEYATDVLHDLATATYEFSVDSGNFLFAKEFAPFRNNLELGRGIYLNIGGGQVITPYMIEFELDFEENDSFSLVFSNRFKRHDSVNTMKDMLETSYSSSRSFDASKYTYGQSASQVSYVTKFLNDSVDAAKNTILAAAGQTVVIDGAGIHVGGSSEDDYSGDQLRIVNSMIAMTDDNWGSAKLAIGRFVLEDSGTFFGVNAEVIGGKLIVGNTLVIENVNDKGVMQFRVDSSGAWLQNATFILQGANGGDILIDPDYGIVAGPSNLFTTDGTTVTPSFIDDDGDITFEDDGFMPEGANFYLDIRDGSAYFRGTVVADSGSIGDWVLENGFLYSGENSTYVALNASGDNKHSAYAMWAGGTNPNTAPFSVKKDGTLKANLDDNAINGVITGNGTDLDITQNPSISELNSYLFDPDDGLVVRYKTQLELTAKNIKSTVSASLGSYDTSKLDVSITYTNYGDPESAGYTAADCDGYYYLDQSTGVVYHSDGTSWEEYTTLTLITDVITTDVSKVEQKAESISLKVASVEANSATKSELQVTSDKILSTVSSAEEKYDESALGDEVSISYYGYGLPADSGYAATDCGTSYYLDQKSGIVYFSDGETWSEYKQLDLLTTVLSSTIALTEDSLNSRITALEESSGTLPGGVVTSSELDQTADRILATVSSKSSLYDTSELGYTVSFYGLSNPNEDEDLTIADNEGLYYLDQSTGIVYQCVFDDSAGAYKWVELETLTDILDGVATSASLQITASQILATVSSKSSLYDTSELGYTVSLYDDGAPATAGYKASDYGDYYYLDQTKGDVYYSDGMSWIHKKTLNKITEYADSWIEQNEDSIITAVSQVDENTNSISSLDTRVAQTESSITSIVSSAEYDITGYDITLYGFGTPISAGYAAADHKDKYYLNRENGDVYLSSGRTWTIKATLPTVSKSLSSISQTIDGISLSVTENSGVASIVLTVDGEEQTGKIDMTGMVTFTDLKTNSNTVINGSYITTGTIDASKVTVKNLNAGNITSGTISADMISTGTLDADLITLSNSYGGFKSAKGNDGITSTNGAVLYGGNSFNASSSNYFIATTGGVRMTYNGGKCSIYCTSTGATLEGENRFTGSTNFVGVKDSDFAPNLGSSSYYWDAVYSTSGIISSSDERAKYDILYDMTIYEELFKTLKPTQFRLVDGTSGRYHIGFIAQDVENSMTSSGLDSLAFAGLIKSPVYERELENLEPDTTSEIIDYRYGLRYSEFIALNTHMIQKLYKRIEELEAKVESLSA